MSGRASAKPLASSGFPSDTSLAFFERSNHRARKTKSVTAVSNTIDERCVQSFAEVDGHRLAVISPREQRSGIPIIFVHGISLSVRFWPNALEELLLDGLNWYSVSLPGHAPSSAPESFCSADVTPSLLSGLMTEVIQSHLCADRVVLVGWSTGGFAALCTAAESPELVAGVASISGYARGQWSGSLGLLQQLASEGVLGRMLFKRAMYRTGRHRAVFDFALSNCAADGRSCRRSPGWSRILAPVHDDYARHDPRVMMELFAGLRDIDATPLLSKINAPMLVISGSEDPVIPVAEAQHIAASCPHAQLELVPGAGHMFFAEYGPRFSELLSDWLMTL